MGKLKETLEDEEIEFDEDGQSVEKKRKIVEWKKMRWMFLDTETTGLPPDKKNPNRKDPRVVQIGYTIVDNMKVVETFNELVDPGKDVEIDPSASAITGIDRARLDSAKARNFQEVMKKMRKDIASVDVIMAYNKRFDKQVVEREFKIAGVEFPQKPWLDPMIWFQKNIPLENHKLKTVAKHFEISLDNAHDAGADSEAAALVTIAFIQTFDGLPDDANDVVALQGKWNSELSAARLAAWRQKQKKESADRFSHSKIKYNK